jgi:predicted transcriptional regulator
MTTKLSDSGTQRAIDEAAERVERKVRRELEDARTPALGVRSSDSSETYEIAERVFKREEPGHMRRCLKDGPAAEVCEVVEKVQRDMENVRKEVGDMKQGIAEERGEARGVLRAQARLTTIIVAIGAVVNIAIALYRFRHG